MLSLQTACRPSSLSSTAAPSFFAACTWRPAPMPPSPMMHDSYSSGHAPTLSPTCTAQEAIATTKGLEPSDPMLTPGASSKYDGGVKKAGGCLVM